MKRYNVTEGTRAEILAELEQYGRDRTEHGKLDKARDFKRAIDLFEDGALEVHVGHSRYRVVEDSPAGGEMAAGDDTGLRELIG